MSRTFKDAPWRVRYARTYGKRLHGDWRSKEARWDFDTLYDLPGLLKTWEPIFQRCRPSKADSRNIEAQYRARVKDCMRNGRFDDIPQRPESFEWYL